MTTATSVRLLCVPRPRLAVPLLVALLAGSTALVPRPGDTARAADPVIVTESGYLDAPDGTHLKYTVLRPEGEGPFPTLLQYEGYNAGSNPTRVNDDFGAEMLADGYAIVGVSVRGTACSAGEFDLFSPHWATDGAAAVEWAGSQPWSSGKVGMFSFSYAGFTQLLVAAEQPEHLAAIAPGMVVSDAYRDVGYPGGIANTQFPVAWEAALHLSWAQAAQQAQSMSDPECLANIASHQVLGVPGGVTLSGLQHPYDDRFFRSRSPERGLSRIDVPVLGEMSWQDEQTGVRGGLAFEKTDPRTTWTIGTNGMHGMYAESPRSRALLHQYFDHYLKGERNGWQRTPHVQIWHETAVDGYDPAWVTTSDTRPFPGTVRTFRLGPDGTLGAPVAAGATAGTSYLTPLPSPGLVSEQIAIDQSVAYGVTWQAMPVNPLGSAAFTTAPLTRDLVLTGGASLDLWVTSTAPDADVQVTVTEVRPDGQEVYVQRGWLRLSHRALDRSRSTRTSPYHPHTQAAQRDLPIGEPAAARIEILPFSHAFRTGSSLRIWLDSPSQTGLWGFTPNALPTGVGQPAMLTVLHDAEHPSRLVVTQERGRARGPLPACGALASQPCRRDPLG
ncbi:MAG: CocE/NonD family hydrolase [Actinobacteria bacterium]|uniref:Unannotated protein n=1 Tax=freshwater metagenome TaxID=449393 RepID=A0A6J6R1I5_9ZZZZ|nr:CocE/NonD family hydrolase [Actinomycetota bacterium]